MESGDEERSVQTAPVPSDSPALNVDVVEKLQLLQLDSSNLIKDNIVTYITGYVATPRKLQSQFGR